MGDSMALNHQHGEILAEYGTNHVQVPLSKWLHTEVWDHACASALVRFSHKVKGVTRFDHSEVVAQEYPAQGRLVFIFHKHFNGSDFYVPVSVVFPPDQLAEMVVTGMWSNWDGPRRLVH